MSTTKAIVTDANLLELYERGHSLVAIVDRIGGSVASLQGRMLAAHGKDRLDTAVTRNVEASMERAVMELDAVTGFEDATYLSAIKTKLEFRKWQASMLSQKYKPTPADRGALGGGLVINITGMSGATLRIPHTIEST